MNSFLATGLRAVVVVLVAAVTLTGCQPKGDHSASADSVGMPPRTDTAGGMAGMAGMAGMMSTAMMDSMHMHMQVMDTMSAGRMKEMLPMHRQMAANMLSQMNAEMRNMNMVADAVWTSTADSLRQDLIRMPEMGSQELEAMMPGHHARMMRLMQMHRDMMRKMKVE